MLFNKLVVDIREQPCLWSLKAPVKQEEQDSAWQQVAKKNNLSAVETKLIFRELTKKYKEERKKPKSAWKLLEMLRFLDEDVQPNDEDKLNVSKPPVADQKPQQSLLRPIPRPTSTVEDVKFAQQKPQQTRPSTETNTIPSGEDVKIKSEPTNEEARNLPHNTSEEDYVELLEVRDDGFSDEDNTPDDDDMDMDMEEDDKVKQQFVVPPKPTTNTITTKTPPNKTISVINPAALNNFVTKPEPQAAPATSAVPRNVTSTTAFSPMQQRKIPLIFAGIKRKMSNEGGGEMSVTMLNKSNGQPPQKKPNTIQEKVMEKRVASPVPERVASSPQPAVIVPKESSNASSNVVNTQLPSPTKAEIVSNGMNSTSIEIVHMETEKHRLRGGGSVNIGDVISMPPVDQIKVERNNSDSDSEVDRDIVPSQPSQQSATSSLSESEQTTLAQSQTAQAVLPPQQQPIPSTPHSRMYDSFGQYVANTLNALPKRLANKLEIKVLEAIIAINTEKNSSFD